MPSFLLGRLTVLVCGQASVLSDSIRKMFLLCLFADFIWRNGLETLYITVSRSRYVRKYNQN